MRRQGTKTPSPKALWTCPRCRRRFKNRNQIHSCGQFTVAEAADLNDELADWLQEAYDHRRRKDQGGEDE